MDIYSFICTRSFKNLSPITNTLIQYLSRCNIKTKLLSEKSSIFNAYLEAFNSINPDDEDIIILCHDDIEIISNKKILFSELATLEDKNVGFIGVAGTTYLGNDAVWWELERRKQGYHRGFCFQGDSLYDCYPNYFGPPGGVVVLDGLFLATKARTLREIGLEKPSYFEGEWDFYDIHYTLSAYKLGRLNMVVPIHVLHQSSGNLIGRDSWHKNRESFITHNKLPIIHSDGNFSKV